MMQVIYRTNPLRLSLALIIVFLLSAFLVSTDSQAANSQKGHQKTFDSPEEGIMAMIEALQVNNDKVLLSIFGPTGMKLISFGNTVASQEVRDAFLTNYQEKNRLEMVGDIKAILHTGNNDWPFPIPLVKKGQTWYFDSLAGKEEVLNRKIGGNELSAIQVCLAYVDAQKEYALGDHDRDGFFAYAQKFVSDPGKKNGLYWKTLEGERPSLLGPAIARATQETCKQIKSVGPPHPYHGYYYKILTAQGKNTPGGAYDYIVNGKMIGGFALVAYPAKYGQSGIMTFIVHMDGIVYQKNLGKKTTRAAEAMKLFDPDKTWQMVAYGYALN
jgi:hypothetical protein